MAFDGQCAVVMGKISDAYEMYGHRQAGQTACPGDTLYPTIQSWPHWVNGTHGQIVTFPFNLIYLQTEGSP